MIYRRTLQTKIGRKLQSSTRRLIIITLLISTLPLISLFTVNYLKNSLSQMNVIADQVVSQWDLNTSNIVSFANQIPIDNQLLALLNDETIENREARVVNRLMELCGNLSGIDSIILSCDKGNYHSILINDQQMDELLRSPWFTQFKEKEYRRYFSASEVDNAFYFGMSLNNISSLSGEMILKIRAIDLMQIMKSADKTFSHYLWLDMQDNMILNNDFGQEDYIFPLLSGDQKFLFFNEYTFYNNKGIFISHYSDITHWKYIVYIPYTELLLPFLPIFFVIIISLVLMILFSGYIINPLIHNIVSPIETLSAHMRNFSYEETEPVHIHTGDEIEDLSNAFNDMSRELKKHVEMLLEEQEKEQKLKYGLQISQINPHFIYNTMNTINYLARKERSDDIIVINSALISIMKDSLRINEASVFDTVDTELKVAEQYLKIQEYRYGKIDIFWEVENSVRNFVIPKHIIQPIVENAIIHGFLDDEFESLEGEKPFIKIGICALVDCDGVVIRIEDNGIGIDMEKYERICKESEQFDASGEYNRGKHIGLANIKWRLAYLLNEKQELTVSPRSPHGTIVTIRLQKINEFQ